MLIKLVNVFKNQIGVINLAESAIEVNGDDLVRLFDINHDLEIALTNETEAKNAIGYDVKFKKITHKRNIDINGNYYVQQFKFNVERHGRITCNVTDEQIAGEFPDPMAGRPEGLSDDAWYKVRDGGLPAAEDGSIRRWNDYFHQFPSQDIPIILKNWGAKFKTVNLADYGHKLPPLDFSECVNANSLVLVRLDPVPELSGLDRCRKLRHFDASDLRRVENISPQCLDALPDKVNVYCYDSCLFRRGGYLQNEIDTDQLLAFLQGHSRAEVSGLISYPNYLPKEIQDLLDKGLLKLEGPHKMGVRLGDPKEPPAGLSENA